MNLNNCSKSNWEKINMLMYENKSESVQLSGIKLAWQEQRSRDGSCLKETTFFEVMIRL